MFLLYLIAALLISVNAGSAMSGKDRLTKLEAQVSSLVNELATLKAEKSTSRQDTEIAFHASINEYAPVYDGDTIIFDIIKTNLGGGYDGSTGKFTVPSGGAGVYFFYAHFRVQVGEWAAFDLKLNENTYLCVAYEDEDGGGDQPNTSCGAVLSLAEGDVIEVQYGQGSDDSPIFSSGYPYTTFSGFRVTAA